MFIFITEYICFLLTIPERALLPMKSMLGISVLLIALAISPSIDAQSEPLCQRYSAPPLGAKVDLFADPMPTFDTGQVLPSFGAFAVKLKQANRVIYPYKSPNDHDAGMGAVLAIEHVPTGTYRIGLSAAAQVDVIQENIRLPVKELQANQACPGIDRSFDVQASAGPLILQVSGASVELLKMLIIPLPIEGADAPNSVSTVAAQ